MIDLHLSAFAPRWRFLYAVRIDAYSDTVSNNELGSYIGILAENVIFNAETKIPLSKEELRKIDWYGENAGQHREQWIYKDIYEIHGTEKTEAVAVQINDRYYIAKRQ